MSITVRRAPERLTWADFISIPIVIDPNDGTERIAFTAFDFDIPDRPPRTIDGQLAVAENFEIIITPRARVKRGDHSPRSYWPMNSSITISDLW